eukprot:NODE_26_length_40862_cov_0.679513.p5 type:complete len:782 gc:universal NODE_26_length_40862_cov_0.679513:15155-12810(-)
MPYFVVLVGRKTGIFERATESRAQTEGFTGQFSKRFDNKKDAEYFLMKWFKERNLAKRVGGAPPDPFLFSKRNEFKSLKASKNANSYYVVAVGRKVGIYTSHSEARKHCDGTSGQKLRGFKSYEEAEAFFLDYNPNMRVPFYSNSTGSFPKKDTNINEDKNYHPCYCVPTGLCPGLFDSRDTAMRKNGSDAKIIPFKTLAEAESSFKSLNPHTSPVHFRDHNSEEKSSNNLGPKLTDLHRSNFPNSLRSRHSKYYVIPSGQGNGIYLSLELAKRYYDNPIYVDNKDDAIKLYKESNPFIEPYIFEFEPKSDSALGSSAYDDAIVCYSVAVGRKIGIFENMSEAKLASERYPGQKIRKCKSAAEAVSFFKEFNPGVEPKFYPSYKGTNKYWAVAVGPKCKIGIYVNIYEARKVSDGYPGQKLKGFETYEEALQFFNEYNPGIIPKFFESRIFYSATTDDTSTLSTSQTASSISPHESMSCLPLDAKPEHKISATKEKYYSVVVGRKTGIFTSLEEAKKLTSGYPNQRMRTFTSYDRARAYYLQYHPESTLESYPSLPSETKHRKEETSSTVSSLVINYASHMIYVRIPISGLQDGVTDPKLKDRKWIKHGITSQSLRDRSLREEFEKDCGYFKYSLVLNDREHATQVESHFNEIYKDLSISDKSEYFYMADLARYYGVFPTYEAVAERHFCEIIKFLLQNYSQYIENIEDRLQKYEYRLGGSSLDVTPVKFNIPKHLSDFIKSQKSEPSRKTTFDDIIEEKGFSAKDVAELLEAIQSKLQSK